MCLRDAKFHSILFYLFFRIVFHSYISYLMIGVEVGGLSKTQRKRRKGKKTLLRWWKFVQSFIYSIRGLYGSPVKWNHLIRRWYKYSTEVLQLNSVIATWSINCVFLYAVCSYKIASVWSIVPSILLLIFSGNSGDSAQPSQTPE